MQRNHQRRTLTRQPFKSLTYRCGMVSAAGKYKCNTCNKSFAGRWHLERHTKQVVECSDGSVAPSFDCSLCNRKFKRHSGLERHRTSNRHKRKAEAMLGKATRTGTTCTAACETDNIKIVDPLEREDITRGLSVVAGVGTKMPQGLSNTIASTSGPDPNDNDPWAVQDQKHNLQLAASHQSKCALTKVDSGPCEIVQSSQELPEGVTQPVLSETDTRDGALIALPLRPSRRPAFTGPDNAACMHPAEQDFAETDRCYHDDPMGIGALFGGSTHTGSCQWSSQKSEMSVHYKRLSDHQEMGAPGLFPVDEELRNGRLQTMFSQRAMMSSSSFLDFSDFECQSEG